MKRGIAFIILVVAMAFMPLTLHENESMTTGLLVRLGLLVAFMIGMSSYKAQYKINKPLTWKIE